jgi:hypothetical protein
MRVLKMRDEYRNRMGARFRLKAFHQRLLQIGSMPPALVRESCRRSDMDRAELESRRVTLALARRGASRGH